MVLISVSGVVEEKKNSTGSGKTRLSSSLISLFVLRSAHILTLTHKSHPEPEGLWGAGGGAHLGTFKSQFVKLCMKMMQHVSDKVKQSSH